jgi:hypothetical protein
VARGSGADGAHVAILLICRFHSFKTRLVMAFDGDRLQLVAGVACGTASMSMQCR